jgi:hypothetical protein
MSLTLPDIDAGPVPDYVEPVEAWRVWRVCMRDGRVLLESLFAATVWEPTVALTAACAKRCRSRWRPWRVQTNTHDVPELDCSCGIYGVSSVSTARWYLESRTFLCRGERVIGRVALWGDVVESQLGWRASRAYPMELFLPAPVSGFRRRPYMDEIAHALSAYEVPVAVVSSHALSID